MRHRSPLSYQELETRICLTSILFDTHVADESGGFVHAADLDGDDDLDILASRFGSEFGPDANDGIVWFENTDGQGTFGAERMITDESDGAWEIYAADIDGDGDQDVVSASMYGNNVAWYENLDGAGEFGPQQAITSDAFLTKSVHAQDMDNDGDFDVLSAAIWGGTVAWYENLDGSGDFGSPNVIWTDLGEARSVYAADVDGDGDMDALSASWDDATIAWYENADGQGAFERQIVISTEANGANQVFAVDIDKDGDVDVLAACYGDAGELGKFTWYENIDGRGTFGPEHVITTADQGYSIYATDFDGDGDVDVLSAAQGDHKIAWYENTDGTGAFGRQQVITVLGDGGVYVYAGDVDGDGDPDALSSSNGGDNEFDDRIAWHENLGVGDPGSNVILFDSPITLRTGAGPEAITAADLDRDGFPDLMTANFAENSVSIFYGDGAQFAEAPSVSVGREPTAVVAVDLDGAHGLDLITANEFTGDVSVLLSQGDRVMAPQVRYETGTFTQGVTAADVNDDGALDILVAASGTLEEMGQVSVLMGDPAGSGRFATAVTIMEKSGPISLVTGHFNDDAHLDLAVASFGFGDDEVSVLLGTGEGKFGPPTNMKAGAFPWAIDAADLDGDAQLDLVVTNWFSNDISVFRGRGDGTFEAAASHLVGEMPQPLALADLNGDGHVDVATGNTGDETASVLLGRGDGTFQPPILVSVGGNPSGIVAEDFDRDGRLDLAVSIEDTSIVAVLLQQWIPGDSNGDGRFDSSDLVMVFVAGEYEDEIQGNSTWEEGDWDGDGDFSSSDLVAAFTAGYYVTAAQPAPSPAAVAAVAAGVQQPSVAAIARVDLARPAFKVSTDELEFLRHQSVGRPVDLSLAPASTHVDAFRAQVTTVDMAIESWSSDATLDLPLEAGDDWAML